MNTPKSYGWAAIGWALLIGVGIVVLAGSILLPSTKRARVDFDALRARDQTTTTETSAAPETSDPPATAPAP